MPNLAVPNVPFVEETAQFSCGGDTLYGVLARPQKSVHTARTGVVVIVGGPQTRVGSHRQFVLLSRALAAALATTPPSRRPPPPRRAVCATSTRGRCAKLRTGTAALARHTGRDGRMPGRPNHFRRHLGRGGEARSRPGPAGRIHRRHGQLDVVLPAVSKV